MGTRRHWLPDVDVEAVYLSTTGLTGLGDIRGENLTAKFPLGQPLSEVQTKLDEDGFWFPFEQMDGTNGTLGGVLAAGLANPWRYGYGTLRDWVLGLEVVTGAGEVLSLGGEVVKNVAGYNMVPVHLGAWGTLGLLTRATIRILPRPQARRFVACEGRAQPEAVESAIRASLSSFASPQAVELVLENDSFLLLVGLVGREERVEARLSLLEEDLKGQCQGWAISVDERQERLWDPVAEARLQLEQRYDWRLRVSVHRPGANTLMSSLPRLAGAGEWALAGHAGNGVYTVYWRDNAGPLRLMNGLMSDIPYEGGVVAEGVTCSAILGENRWVSFPPRSPRSQDRVEASVVREISGGIVINPHLPRVSLVEI